MESITHNGKTQSLPAWTCGLGIPENTLRSRLGKLGQSSEQAFASPSDARFRPGSGSVIVRASSSVPRLLHDKRDRQGYARWLDPTTRERKSKKFGPWGHPETVRAHQRWVAEWCSNQGHAPAKSSNDISVAALILRHVDWAAIHYLKHGRPTSELHKIRSALRFVNELYGNIAAAAFSPQDLKCCSAYQVLLG